MCLPTLKTHLNLDLDICSFALAKARKPVLSHSKQVLCTTPDLNPEILQNPMLDAERPKLHAGGFDLLRKVPQFGQFIQQFLQICVRNLVLETGDQRLGFLRIVAAQTA